MEINTLLAYSRTFLSWGAGAVSPLLFFTLRLKELRACLPSVADFRWKALGLNYPERPHV
jgi:hypothetical protein